MKIDPSWTNYVDSLNKIDSSNKALGTSSPGGVESLDFGEMFNAAMDKINSTDKISADAGNKLATGALENPHDLTIASTEAELTLNYAIEVKNRIIEAYKEVMRMQF